MIQGLLENGFEEDAFDLFNKMRKGSDNSSLDFPDRNVYSTILDFYLKNRDIENAYTILNEMIQSSNANSNPSFSSYALFFSYFIKNNDFIQLEQMIDKMLRESTIPLNAEIYAHIFSESVKYSNVQEGLRYLRKSQRLMNNQTTMHEMIPLLFHRVQIPPKLK
jgi:pentatricopeptide repeat protein